MDKTKDSTVLLNELETAVKIYDVGKISVYVESLTDIQNKKRCHLLIAKLLNKGYMVLQRHTKALETGGNNFLVIDNQIKKTLQNDLEELSLEFQIANFQIIQKDNLAQKEYFLSLLMGFERIRAPGNFFGKWACFLIAKEMPEKIDEN